MTAAEVFVGDYGQLLGPSVTDYQRRAGLVPDGKIGAQTRSAIIADQRAARDSLWSGFRGSFGLLVRSEGHRPVPYHPTPESGVTLGYGWDLRWQNRADLERIWGGLFAPEDLEPLASALGLAGTAAASWVQQPLGRWYHVAEAAAVRLPQQAEPYWRAAISEWPELVDAPGTAQTAILDACYNAWVGPVRAARDACRAALTHPWRAAAAALEVYPGPRDRRQLEAALMRMGG